MFQYLNLNHSLNFTIICVSKFQHRHILKRFQFERKMSKSFVNSSSFLTFTRPLEITIEHTYHRAGIFGDPEISWSRRNEEMRRFWNLHDLEISDHGGNLRAATWSSSCGSESRSGGVSVLPITVYTMAYIRGPSPWIG